MAMLCCDVLLKEHEDFGAVVQGGTLWLEIGFNAFRGFPGSEVATVWPLLGDCCFRAPVVETAAAAGPLSWRCRCGAAAARLQWDCRGTAVGVVLVHGLAEAVTARTHENVHPQARGGHFCDAWESPPRPSCQGSRKCPPSGSEWTFS